VTKAPPYWRAEDKGLILAVQDSLAEPLAGGR